MKTITRTLAALVLAAGFSTMVSAQNVTLSTSSKIDFTRVKDNTATVRMNRVLYAGYNTICLPFSVSASDLQKAVGEGVMLEKLVKAEAGVLTFIDVTADGIEAGMPYLIYSPTKKVASFITGDLNLVEKPKTITVGGATMSGRFEPTQEMNLFGIPALQDDEILQSILVRTEGDKTFLPTRCGISYPAATETPIIMHVTDMDGATTAIAALQANNTRVDIYNTNGTLVKKSVGMNDAMNTLSRGIYVVNGLKFVVK